MKPESLDRVPKAENEAVELWKAVVLAFAERVFSEATEDERMGLDRTAGESGFCEDALRFAVQHAERFKAALVELIEHLAVISKNVLFDPVHLGGLYLDRFQEVVVTQGERAEIDFGAEEKGAMHMVPDKVLMLTGPQRGRMKTGADIDIVYPKPLSVTAIEE